MREFLVQYIQPIRLETINYKDTKFKRNSLQVFNNPKYENIVRQLYGMSKYQVKLYNLLDEEIDEILKLLDQEIQ